MATDLSEAKSMDAMGIGEDRDADDRGEGVLGNKRAGSIVATGSKKRSDERSMGKRK